MNSHTITSSDAIYLALGDPTDSDTNIVAVTDFEK